MQGDVYTMLTDARQRVAQLECALQAIATKQMTAAACADTAQHALTGHQTAPQTKPQPIRRSPMITETRGRSS